MPAQDARRLPGLRRRVRRDAGVERLALPDGGRERPHRLLERGVGIESVRVEDVDVVETHAPQALIEAREHVLPRATALPVRPRPHVPAGFRRDDQLVPIRGEVLPEQSAEVDLGAPVRRPVVVGEVEVGDPEVERGAEHRTLRVQRRRVAEVLPEAERDRRELQPAPPTGAVRHAVVSIGRSLVPHGCTVPEPWLPRPRGSVARRTSMGRGGAVRREVVRRTGTGRGSGIRSR